MEAVRLIGLVASALLALGNFASRRRSRSNTLLALLMAAKSFGFIGALRGSAGLMAIEGILMYALFLSLSGREGGRLRMPTAPLFLLAPALLADAIALGVGAPPPFLVDPGVPLFRGATGLAVLLLCASAAFHVFRAYGPGAMGARAWAILIVSASAMASIVVAAASAPFPGKALAEASLSLDCVEAVAFALLYFRYPEAMSEFATETERRRYAKSKLRGLDADGLSAGMIEAVQSEGLYRDDGFSLEALAARMGLSAHQVSELLNDRLGMGFAAFVNGFRLDEAKRLLASEPGMTVIEIAMEVGFGNKTSFNEAFKRREGTTPSAFRKSRENQSQEL